jgi:cytochrome b6-f complex iron-sulfur subunit
MNETDKVSRRDFVGWIIKGGLLATLGGMLLPALEYLLPVMRRGPGGGMKEVARLEDIPVWGAKKIVLGGSAIMLVRTATDVKAFSAVCTHLGCLVDWVEQKREILCPCHAGRFALDGRVTGGPPPRPLPSYQAHVADGKIFVEL